ncbi:MAG TPA: restriction endonuclease [Ignavibacteriaceae bacterium]|nr:restriction endonuclease [Ignavibacteriaceae bacterium]
MLRSVRKKVATSISKVDQVEDFHFHTWLRIPTIESISTGSINSYVKDIPGIVYSINFPDLYEQTVGLSSPNLLPKFDYYFFEKVKSNTVFFNMNPAESRGIDLTGIQPEPQGYIAQNIEFVFPLNEVRDFKVRFSINLLGEQQFRFEAPEVVDCLSTMVPEVINIQLLKVEEIEKSYKSLKIDKLEIEELKKTKIKKVAVPVIKKENKIYKVKIPGIGKFDSALSSLKIGMLKSPKISENSELNFPKISLSSGKVDFADGHNYKYYDSKDEELSELKNFKQKEFHSPKKIKDELKLILNQIQQTEWKERREEQFQLLSYEEEGAEFLANNNHALLIDEFGLSTQRETLAALKFLFNNRIIKTALIICGTGKAGNVELSRKCDLQIGWLGYLIKYCPELSISEVNGVDDERADAWSKSVMVYVADHRTIVNDFHMKIIDQKKFKRFDCIILDEVHSLIDRGDKENDLLHGLNPQILWALSGLVYEKIETNLNASLNKNAKIQAVKIRRKEDVKDKTPQFSWNENWITLDEVQQSEYKETLVECQKDLRRVLETGNPYRFQANIFTLLHRLKQICNFGQGKSESPKTDLLLEQVSMIKNNNKKVVVFSQYDRLGTKKLEKVFEENGIKHILAPGSLSTDDMNKSIEKFRNSNEITAFITDAKISKLKFGSFIVPYIIKFDHWWNPINVWELQDIFEFNSKAKDISISVYSYNVHKTIDQDVAELLSKKGFLNRNMMEMMQSKVFDELISVDEWLKFFNLAPTRDIAEPQPESMLKTLGESKLNNFKTLLSKLFNKLGYSKIDIADKSSSGVFTITGESVRNGNSLIMFCRVLTDELVSQKSVSSIIKESTGSRASKTIIVTKGRFEEECKNIVNENVSLIDGITLANYILSFSMQESPAAEPASE